MRVPRRVTNVPTPLRVVTSPCRTSSRRARRTVSRAARKRMQSAASLGSFPSGNACAAIFSFNASMMARCFIGDECSRMPRRLQPV